MNDETASPFVERRSANLLAATQRALWPLVALLVHRGIGYPSLAETLKGVFFRVAREKFPLESKPATDSRLSVLTGIHRRDIKRLRQDAMSGPEADSADSASATALLGISLSARVIALWTGMPEYTDSEGRPKALHRLARNGGEQSFESLVRSVNRDVRPRALLDEWLRRDAVRLDEEDRVCLNLNVFMAQKDLDEKAFYFAQNIHDHLAAITHNMTVTGSPFLERCVFYGGLTPQAVAELAELARDEGMKTLQLLNRRALQLKARDEQSSTARYRMNFGVYFFSAEASSPARGDETQQTSGHGDA